MHVFLSYQSRDLDTAERLAESLRRERPDDEVTSRMVVDAMLLRARADVCRRVQDNERGAGLVQAPLT